MKITKPLEFDYPELSVCGLDEAGRGPIAGPLVVAGVIFPMGYTHPELYDSKKLSLKKRLAFFEEIKRDALKFEIKVVSPSVIDELNIYRATQLTMENIAKSLDASMTLTDAMKFTDYDKAYLPVIKGDQKSFSIAAASILAKVVRDHIMECYDVQYPEYGFAKHKGYPTKAHLENLETYGVLKIHRKSYKPVANKLQKQLSFFE